VINDVKILCPFCNKKSLDLSVLLLRTIEITQELFAANCWLEMTMGATWGSKVAPSLVSNLDS
jgi:hypothetical protein